MEESKLIIEEPVLEEESSILSKICVAKKNYEWIKNEVLVAIIQCDKSDFSSKLSGIEVCGKTLLDWVLMATTGCQQKILAEEADNDLLNSLKNLNTNKKYIYLAYSDTPFLQTQTFYEIMDYFCINNLNCLKLPRGMVIKTEYLHSVSDLDVGVRKTFGDLDFERVATTNMLSKFFQFMSAKIKNYHKKNGVILFSEETIFIDADVEIESGTIVYPNNVLKGQTYIGKNVLLDCGNIIEDSIISDECYILSSHINKSKIRNGQSIGPYKNIENESI